MKSMTSGASSGTDSEYGGCATASSGPEKVDEPGAEGGRAAVARVADVLATESCLRDAPDGDHAAAGGEPLDVREPAVDLRPRRRPIGRCRARMRRHDVPEQHVLGKTEVGQHALHDRRRRLGRPCAGEQALGGERDPRETRAAVAGRLADEQHARLPPRLEVLRQPRAEETGSGSVSIEVERLADVGAGEVGDERSDAPIAAPSRETMTRSDSHTGGWTTSESAIFAPTKTSTAASPTLR